MTSGVNVWATLHKSAGSISAVQSETNQVRDKADATQSSLNATDKIADGAAVQLNADDKDIKQLQKENVVTYITVHPRTKK